MIKRRSTISWRDARRIFVTEVEENSCASRMKYSIVKKRIIKRMIIAPITRGPFFLLPSIFIPCL
jgi:hypothetical protein